MLIKKVVVVQAVKAQPCHCPSLTEFIQMAGLDMADLKPCPAVALSHHQLQRAMCRTSEYHWLTLPMRKLKTLSACPVPFFLVSFVWSFSTASVITLNLAVVFQKAVTYTLCFI